MGDLDRHRRAVEQHDLVAPVELVGFSGRKTQRHKRRGHTGRAIPAPGPGVAPDRIIAPLVIEARQLLEYPDQRQPLACRLPFVGQQQPVQLSLPRANPRQRLLLPFIGKTRLARSDDLAHCVARNMQLPRDLLDGLALHEICPTNPCNRIHALHPPTARQIQNRQSDQQIQGAKLDADYPHNRVNFARRNTPHHRPCGKVRAA